MRKRIAILGLAAVLGVLPALITTPAAPVPKRDREKNPDIYALIYVGIGRNHPYNAKRISDALHSIFVPAEKRTAGNFYSVAAREPKVKDLPIVKDKEKKLGVKGRDDWADSKTRVANLEGTAVVRVWFTDGTPQEQVVIVNAMASAYIKDLQQAFRGALERLQQYKRDFKKQQEDAGAKVTEENEREFRFQEEVIKHLPHVIEWASLPDKP